MIRSCILRGSVTNQVPFGEPENTAAITCRHIIENDDDILYVSHDADDGMWQFLCGSSHSQEDARIVSLNEIFMLDNTVSKLANMPCGYVAERKSKNSDRIVQKR